MITHHKIVLKQTLGYSQTTLLSIQDSRKTRNNSSTDLYWFYNDLTIMPKRPLVLTEKLD